MKRSSTSDRRVANMWHLTRKFPSSSTRGRVHVNSFRKNILTKHLLLKKSCYSPRLRRNLRKLLRKWLFVHSVWFTSGALKDSCFCNFLKFDSHHIVVRFFRTHTVTMALWNYEYSLNFRYLSTFFVDVRKATEMNNLSNTSCLPVYQLKYRLCVNSRRAGARELPRTVRGRGVETSPPNSAPKTSKNVRKLVKSYT